MEAVVRLAHLHSCHVQIPPLWSDSIRPSQAIRLEWENHFVFVGWNGFAFAHALPEFGSSQGSTARLSNGRLAAEYDFIVMDHEFASVLGLTDYQLVKINVERKVEQAQSISVEPVSEDDWEIMELNAELAETQLLNQIRIVFPEQIILLKFHGGSAVVKLRMTEMTPKASCLRLDNDTEVCIAPKLRHYESANDKAASGDEWALSLKVLPLSYSHIPFNLIRPDTSYIHQSIVKRFLSTQKTLKWPQLVGLTSTSHTNDDKEVENEWLVKLGVVDENVQIANGDRNNIFIPDGLLRAMGCEPLSFLKIEPCSDSLPSAKASFSIVNGSATKEASLDYLKRTLKRQSLVLNENQLIHGPESMLLKVHIPSGEPYIYLTDESSIIITSMFNEDIYSFSSWPEIPIPGLESLKDDVVEHIEVSFCINLSEPPKILITGKTGSGRTSLLKAIAHDLHHSNENRCIVCYIDCADMVQSIPTFVKELKWHVQEAKLCAPAVIVLDDADLILSKEGEMMPMIYEFLEMIQSCLCGSKIALIASGNSYESFHPYLKQNNFFTKHIQINEPDLNRRVQVLAHLMQDFSFEQSDIKTVATNMEGYTISDIQSVLLRAKHDRVEPTFASVMSILNEFVPHNMAGVKITTPQNNWEDIGGMHATKKILMETLMWPTRYEPIFKQCKLKLRSGILLYGPPGCGKTLIASAIASQCDMKMISVKGPELLNKYIGASEQATRDIFERAKATKPCILFFDEFDSLAPTRGHDSTGVTDRVVNQLLTLLDGAEDREGVFVLAATSRPDLIDPALLRPGRLDKSIYCGLPEECERLEILNLLKTSHNIDSIDMDFFASRSVNWTGADLQAFMSNAYLEAVKDFVGRQVVTPSQNQQTVENTSLPFMVLNDKENTDSKNENLDSYMRKLSSKISANKSRKISSVKSDSVRITKAHLTNAFESVRPSLSVSELKRYEHIYNNFVNGRVEIGKQKGTLA